MKTLTKYKGTLAAIAVFLLFIFLYNTFLKSDTVPADPSVSVSTLGADLIALSERLEGVRLNQELFSTDIYRSLVDFSIEIPDQPKGRVNPFAAVGRD